MHHCTLYAKSTANIESKCSLQLHKASTTPIPTQIMPDVWILATPTSAPTDTISLICPEKPMETIPIRQTLHVLKLPAGLQCHFSKLLPASKVWNTHLECKCFTKYGKPTELSTSLLYIFVHLATHGKESQWNRAPTSCYLLLYHPYQYTRYINTFSITPYTWHPSTCSHQKIQTHYAKLFSHPGIYISALGSILPVGVGLFCCYFFWCWPARLACWPLQSGNMQYTIVDDNVEEAPIYRCKGRAPKPTRPRENHGLAIEHLPTWLESHQEPHSKSFAVPIQGSLDKSSKIQGTKGCT